MQRLNDSVRWWAAIAVGLLAHGTGGLSLVFALATEGLSQVSRWLAPDDLEDVE